MSAEYYGGGSVNAVAPTATKIVLTFLAQPGQTSTGAWLLARAGINADGPVRVRLVDQYGAPLSNTVEVNSSSLERVRMLGVHVPAEGAFPTVVRVEAQNRSTVTNSHAAVEGVLLEYSTSA